MLNASVYVHVYVSVVYTHYCSQIYIIYLATVVCVITSQLSVLVIFY